jgi:hypothetical protein
MKRSLFSYFLTAAVFAALYVPTAGAATITGTAGSCGPESVDYTFSAFSGGFTLAVTNNTAGPTSICQAVSGVDLTLSGGLVGSLTSVTDTQSLINIASNGTITNAAGSPDWIQPSTSSNFVTALGSSGPDDTLLGPVCASGNYSCSNSSIAGNDPHNPFAVGTVTLHYSGAGITSATQLSGIIVYFGTDTEHITSNVPSVPEPATWWLTGIGLAALIVGSKKIRRSQASI